jgi:hypothetical protein
MERNDLSSRPVPRLCLVFEGALAWLPPGDRKKRREYDRLISRGKWGEAVDLYEFNQKMELVIWDRAYKLGMQMDIITYLPGDDASESARREFANEVARRVGDEQLPIHDVWGTTPQKLGRQLSYMRDIACVYDPFPEHRLMGSPGRWHYLTDPNQFGC